MQNIENRETNEGIIIPQNPNSNEFMPGVRYSGINLADTYRLVSTGEFVATGLKNDLQANWLENQLQLTWTEYYRDDPNHQMMATFNESGLMIKLECTNSKYGRWANTWVYDEKNRVIEKRAYGGFQNNFSLGRYQYLDEESDKHTVSESVFKPRGQWEYIYQDPI